MAMPYVQFGARARERERERELNFIIDRLFEDGSITGSWALEDLTPPRPLNIIHPFRRSFQHIYFIFY